MSITLAFFTATSLWPCPFLHRADVLGPHWGVPRRWDPCSVKKGNRTDSNKSARHMCLGDISTSRFPLGWFYVSVMVSPHYCYEFVSSGMCSSVLLSSLCETGRAIFISCCRDILIPATDKGLQWPLHFLFPPKVSVFGGKVAWAECIILTSEDAPLAYVTALWHFSYCLFTS